MKELKVFDPPMCCSSGVCGPAVNPELVKFSTDLDWLKSRGICVVRCNPAQQYEEFLAHPVVVETINGQGADCLPILLIDGAIVSTGRYPDRDELASWLEIERENDQ